MTIPLQDKLIYGPLRSRRFGRSLGVNLLPRGQKICNFNCPYCQYENTVTEKPLGFPSLEEIEAEVERLFVDLKERKEEIDWITVAGNGEPTLHPEFPHAARLLATLRNEFLPGVPVGILSNASTCHRPEIREGLLCFDGRFMKLDAGSAQAFRSVNEPSSGIRWEEMIEGLRLLPGIVLQSFFFTGYFKENVGEQAVNDWIETVGAVQPESVQVYSLDRPPRDSRILPVSRRILQEIADRLTERTGVQAYVFE